MLHLFKAKNNKRGISIYFDTPIIVSEYCYLGDKVKELNIGFTVNPLDEIAIKPPLIIFIKKSFKLDFLRFIFIN